MFEFRRRHVVRKLVCPAAVLVVTVTLLIALSVLFYPKDNLESFGMRDEKANGVLGERPNSIDVIFVGDSEAYSSFSPLQMWNEHGFTSYVCATSGQRLPYGNTLLRRATREQSPRVVVIETNSVFSKFSSGDAVFRTLQDVLPVFEYHNRWKSLSPEDLTTRIVATHTDDLKGFYINRAVKKADAKRHMASSDALHPLPVINKMYLCLIVNHCKAIGAKPLLVSTPSTVNWSTPRHNTIQALADEMRLDYIDLNLDPTKVSIDWSRDTRDGGDHLNVRGAKKVSAYIGEYLARSYDLPDHRQDSAYDSWNDSLKRFSELV